MVAPVVASTATSNSGGNTVSSLNCTLPSGTVAGSYIICNGCELSSGSLRIYTSEMQRKIFKLLGYSDEEVEERFGHLLEAFDYGAPPHGGIAPGIDRICMILADEPNIREVIAFPKNQAARDVMADAPSPVEPEQLKELHITIKD